MPRVPVQQASQLVSHVDHHHLLAGGGQGGDVALDGLGHTGVDGAAETTVRGHTDDQMLASLILGGLDLGLLVQG